MNKKGLSMPKAKILSIIGLLCLLVFSVKTEAQNRKRVEILRCDLLDVNERIIANARRLLGNVNITVDGALMWCDSLYSYTNSNMVDAFGHVHIIRGDTLNMYADFINYNGDTKLAKARRNVRLIDKKVTLTTDSLDYTMVTDVASYNYNGTIKDSTNVLTSKIGQYFVNDKKAFFKTKVDVDTKDYKIKSDTLIYYTITKKVQIEGPTYIFNETDTLYSEFGWYDSMKGYAQLTRNPRIWNVNQKLKADSIFYNKEKGEGLALGNARIEDIENSIIVCGNKVEYNDLTKIALASDSAMLIQYSETDSLYLHADYLRTMPDTSKAVVVNPVKKLSVKLKPETSVTDSIAVKEMLKNELVPDSLLTESKSKEIVADSLKYSSLSKETVPDSLTSGVLKTKGILPDFLASDTLIAQSPADTLTSKPKKEPRLVLAYHKVRFFREDFQGKCDSLAYWSKDSTVQLYTDPILWSDKNQMTASYIEMVNRTKDPDEVRMKEDAFIVSMEADSIRFNQIKGKNMIGFVKDNNLYKINVDGNGQTNYYARDKNGIIGLNKAESSNITIYLDKGKVKKIVLIKSPEGELKPLAELEEGDKLLPGFKWYEYLRPKNKEDIFIVPDSDSVPKPKVTAPEVPELQEK